MQKIGIYGFALLAAAAILLGAGCVNNNKNMCGVLLRPPPPVLVLPSPGSTGVPTNVGALYFLAYVTPDIVTVTKEAAMPVTAATMVPAPGPLPSSLPTPAGLIYGMISIPTLSPSTAYTVTNVRTFTDPCGGSETSVQSFTTQ